MAEEVKGRQMDFLDPQNRPITVFSTDGKDRTSGEFSQAMQSYQKSGKLPDGVTFFERGSMGDAVRRGYESVRAPVQEGAKLAGAGLGLAAGTSPLLLGLAKLGLISPRTAQAPAAMGAKIGEGTADFATAPLDTLETAAQATGSAAAAALSGGMTVPVQALAMAAGTGLGRMAGSTLAGSGPEPGKALIQAGIAGIGQGAFGIIRSAITGTASQKAANAVSKDLLGVIRDEIGPVATDPGAFNAYTSDPKRLNRLVQMGAKAFRMDLGDAVDNVIDAVNNKAPGVLSRADASGLKQLASNLYETGNAMLENAGDKTALRAGMAEINNIQRQMQELVINAFPTPVDKVDSLVIAKAKRATIENLNNALSAIQKQVNGMMGGSEVLGALKRSSAERGFSLPNFQKEIQGYFAENPGSAMARAGEIAFGGTSGAKYSTSITPSFRIPISPSKRITIPALGQRNVVRGESAVPSTVGALAGQSALRSFVRPDNE